MGNEKQYVWNNRLKRLRIIENGKENVITGERALKKYYEINDNEM